MIRTPGNTKPPLPPSLEERYGVETLCANWNPMVPLTSSFHDSHSERLGLSSDCDVRDIEDFLDRIHLYACQS